MKQYRFASIYPQRVASVVHQNHLDRHLCHLDCIQHKGSFQLLVESKQHYSPRSSKLAKLLDVELCSPFLLRKITKWFLVNVSLYFCYFIASHSKVHNIFNMAIRERKLIIKRKDVITKQTTLLH